MKYMIDMLYKNPKAYFLDFDGVVVESADIKTEAFYDLYLPYGLDVAQRAKDYHLQFQGITRYKKIKEIHSQYLGEQLSDAKLEELSWAFSSLVLSKILICPLVDGIIEFLEKQQKEGVPVFLLSATPHDELLRITEQRNLSSYFRKQYGAPWTKPAAGEEIIAEHNLIRDQIIFIGDSPSDLEAAQKLGVNFIGRLTENPKPQWARDYTSIHSFRKLI